MLIVLTRDTHLLHLGQLSACVVIVPQVFLVADQDDRDIGAEMLHFRRPFFWYVFWKQIMNTEFSFRSTRSICRRIQFCPRRIAMNAFPSSSQKDIEGLKSSVLAGQLAVRRWHVEMEFYFLRGLVCRLWESALGTAVPRGERSFSGSDRKNYVPKDLTPGNVVS